MAPSSRDRISVDLRGMKAALVYRARARGVSLLDFVRVVLADSLGRVEPPAADRSHACFLPPEQRRVRLSLRMSKGEAAATLAAARAAGVAAGAYVAGLVADVPAGGGTRGEHLAALVASNATLATLGRNLGQSTSLLHQSSGHEAREYREVLDEIAHDVRNHLALAAAVLADLQPRRGRPAPTRPSLA